MPIENEIDLDRLLKLRLIVARYGEMDGAKWWNTKGQLGELGAVVLQRGFPRTYRFAQARSVFAVAAHRCAEVFDPPDSVTLWRLPEVVEESFDARWESWLENAANWEPFFASLESLAPEDLIAAIQERVSLSAPALETYRKLRRSAEGRAVPLPEPFSGSDDDVTLLALGFARGEPGALAVPYAKRAES